MKRPLAIPPSGRAGFTLIELIVVIAIIAILSAIILPSSRLLGERQDWQKCMANLKAIGLSLALYREDYAGFPPDATEFFPRPDGGQESGLGLVTLYYLHVYAKQPPPWERVRNPEAPALSDSGGYLGGDYLRNIKFFHCPRNPIELSRSGLTDRNFWPYFGGYANYDLFYRRDWARSFPQLHTDFALAARWGERSLLTAFPPSDTPVTWCIYHRNAPRVQIKAETHAVIDASQLSPGDRLLVLFADGSVTSKLSPDPAHYPEWLADLTQRRE